MLAYFGLSLFVSAALLFLVQPMIGKMILPQLGGTPAVWNTCMVFFQGVLLIGYGYTHLLTTTQSTRRQVLIQGVLLFLPFIVLPFSVGDWEPPTDANPVFEVLLKLGVMVGLPFFLVSTTAPLLQKWFFHTGHPAAKDPYFLYGASNFGSMLGLALYPTVIEPLLQVTPPPGDTTWRTQVHFWTILYAIFVALVVGCAVIVWQSLAKKMSDPEPAPIEPAPQPAPAAAQATAVTSAGPKRRAARIETVAPKLPVESAVGSAHSNDDITLLRRLRWIGLAAAPTSLMLGATTYLTTDIAAVAFFWIIPLALYLLTFILVFARWPVVWTGTPHTVVSFLQPCLLLFLVLKMIGNLTVDNIAWLSGWDTAVSFFLHLGAFFTTALMCHGELAKDRPSTRHLTEFYFWMSTGGVLGGLFNALFAPIVFQNGLWEYSIAMTFACILRPNLVDAGKTLFPGDSTAERTTRLGTILDFGIPIALGIVSYFLAQAFDTMPNIVRGKNWVMAGMVIAILGLSLRPLRFGLAVGALFLAIGIYDRANDSFLYEGRGFFGLLRVRETEGAWTQMPQHFEDEQVPHEWKVYRTLIHGGINHGSQIVRYKEENELGIESEETDEMNLRKRREPITYFHERNGIAEIFYKLCWPKAQPVTTAKVNLHGASDARMPAAMFGLASGNQAAFAMLANTQSEPPFAVMGLGTGILACYAKPYQRVDIYEIDPLVKNLSVLPDYLPPWDPRRTDTTKVPAPTFYFVQDATERWANVSVKLGDGRLVMKKEAPEGYYHVIVLDAFSSDAIPVHLLTSEAVKMYLSKLADGGVLVFNTTNRYVRIEGVLSAIARDLDLDCLYCPDFTYNSDHPDRFSADWVVLQRKIDGNSYRNGGPPIRKRLESERVRLSWKGTVVSDSDQKPKVDDRWQDVAPLDGPAWTDGYSNLLNPKIMPWLNPWRK